MILAKVSKSCANDVVKTDTGSTEYPNATGELPCIEEFLPLDSTTVLLWMIYLHQKTTGNKDMVTEYADMQVQLYAEYEPKSLLNFLRSMITVCDIERALQICKDRDLVPEMVFILGRVGDNKRALDEYYSEIMMGGRSTISLFNICEDSLLATPLIIDLAILAEVMSSGNEDGVRAMFGVDNARKSTQFLSSNVQLA